MITCYLTYVIAPGKLAEFEHYGRLWTALISKLGGNHYGYFVPSESPFTTEFSFPNGEPGPNNVGVAMFSFPSEEDYNEFRRKAAADPECRAAGEYQRQTNCFTSYQRTFVRRSS
jgi:hypothetical protein